MNKKVVFLPYDMDTAIGNNNEGALVFGYSLEDTDHIGIAEVFNGQSSVLWNNLRETYGPEIKQMYMSLRAGSEFNYEKITKRFEDHQDKWPEAIFNEDAFYKYIMPLIEEGDETYLPMLLGSKAEQRKWWLYNRFRYMDSKYNSGDSLSDRILLRGNAVANITLTPYADIYASIRWGSTLKQQRATRNTAYTIPCPLDSLGDTDLYIYSAGQMADVGDLSGLMLSFADFHSATHLQNIVIGSSDSNYNNQQLRSLSIGNLKLLKKIDVRNCSALGTANENYAAQKNIDLSGCQGIEEVYFDGTNIGSVTLPNGGFLKKLHLPGTITNLTLRNQTRVTEFVCLDFSNVTTLNLENSLTFAQISSILDDVAEGCRVRLFNYRWDFANIAAVHTFLDKFEGLTGMDQNGDNTETPQIFITVHVPSATGDEIDSVTARYPDITVDADVASYYLRYYDTEGNTLLHTETVAKNQNGTWATQPSKSDAQYTYTFVGWSTLRNSSQADPNAVTNITGNRNVYAAYTKTLRTYTITFVRAAEDGGGILQTSTLAYGAMPSYTGATPTTTKTGDFSFNGWSPTITSVTGNQTYTAVFRDNSSTFRKIIEGTFDGAIEDSEVTYIGSYAFVGLSKIRAISFPAAILIDQYAFQSAYYLSEIYIPNAVSIMGSAFAGCGSLTNVQLPNATNIASYAFNYCSCISALSIPNVTQISRSAFTSCRNLQNVYVSELTSLEDGVFEACNSLSFFSAPKLRSVGQSVFRHCRALLSVYMPSVSYFGRYTFAECLSMQSFENLEYSGYITQAMFYNNQSLSYVSFPKATQIERMAFYNCGNLTMLCLPLVTSISSSAFYNCSSLSIASFPMLGYISNNAFQGCTNLTKLILTSTLKTGFYGSNVFQDVPTSNLTIYVNDSLISAYQSALRWFSGRIVGISEL